MDQGGFGTEVSLVDVNHVEDLLDDDGTALVIHADPDNLNHLPPRSAPDQQSSSNGDSGARIVCGAITK